MAAYVGSSLPSWMNAAIKVLNWHHMKYSMDPIKESRYIVLVPGIVPSLDRCHTMEQRYNYLYYLSLN